LLGRTTALAGCAGAGLVGQGRIHPPLRAAFTAADQAGAEAGRAQGGQAALGTFAVAVLPQGDGVASSPWAMM